MSLRRHAAPAAALNSAHLRAFHAVASHRSFTAAAAALGVSQPAVSMAVRALEEAHGVELVIRSRGGAEPTALGEALLEIARQVIALEAQAAELLGAAGDLARGELRVGADAPFLAVPLLARFHEAHPRIDLALKLGNSAEVLRDLLDGRTDVALLSDRADDPRLFAIPAAKSQEVVIVARAHPWAKKSEIRLADLHGAPILVRERGSITRRAFEAAIAKAGVRPQVVMEIGSREALREAVAAGLGAGVIIDAERGSDDRLVALPIAGAPIEHVAYVACLAARRGLRVVAAFLALVPRLPPEARPRRRARK
jgi:aminoethylphosphonate catabolism LysR family transcriptional regulator